MAGNFKPYKYPFETNIAFLVSNILKAFQIINHHHTFHDIMKSDNYFEFEHEIRDLLFGSFLAY